MFCGSALEGFAPASHFAPRHGFSEVPLQALHHMLVLEIFLCACTCVWVCEHVCVSVWVGRKNSLTLDSFPGSDWVWNNAGLTSTTRLKSGWGTFAKALSRISLSWTTHTLFSLLSKVATSQYLPTLQSCLTREKVGDREEVKILNFQSITHVGVFLSHGSFWKRRKEKWHAGRRNEGGDGGKGVCIRPRLYVLSRFVLQQLVTCAPPSHTVLVVPRTNLFTIPPPSHTHTHTPCTVTCHGTRYSIERWIRFQI